MAHMETAFGPEQQIELFLLVVSRESGNILDDPYMLRIFIHNPKP